MIELFVYLLIAVSRFSFQLDPVHFFFIGTCIGGAAGTITICVVTSIVMSWEY